MKTITSGEALMKNLQPKLQAIYAHTLEIAIRPNGPDESFEEGELRVETKFRHMEVEDRLLYRLNVQMSAREYQATVDYVAEYSVKQGFELTEYAAADFFDRCVHATLYPYVRAAFSDLTSRLPVATVTLPLFVPGSVVFAQSDGEESDASS